MHTSNEKSRPKVPYWITSIQSTAQSVRCPIGSCLIAHIQSALAPMELAQLERQNSQSCVFVYNMSGSSVFTSAFSRCWDWLTFLPLFLRSSLFWHSVWLLTDETEPEVLAASAHVTGGSGNPYYAEQLGKDLSQLPLHLSAWSYVITELQG